MKRTTVAIVKRPKKPDEKGVDAIVGKVIELARSLTYIV